MKESKQAKHTPGPWGFGCWFRDFEGQAEIKYKMVSAKAGESLVAKVYDEANARLIAAAPDLLAACEEAYHELRIRCGYKPGDACYDDLAAVMAKAKGI